MYQIYCFKKGQKMQWMFLNVSQKQTHRSPSFSLESELGACVYGIRLQTPCVFYSVVCMRKTCFAVPLLKKKQKNRHTHLWISLWLCWFFFNICIFLFSSGLEKKLIYQILKVSADFFFVCCFRQRLPFTLALCHNNGFIFLSSHTNMFVMCP